MIFKSHIPAIFFVTMLMSSCCHESDSRVAKGYPFGDDHELDIIRNFPLRPSVRNTHASREYTDKFYFDNKDTCEKTLKALDPSCNCGGIDFSKYSVVWVRGSIKEADRGIIQPRAVINHKTKEYKLEIRGYAQYCGDYTHFFISEWCLIPRIPEGYKFIREIFSPVY